MKNWKSILVTGLIAVVAVIVFNKFVKPMLPASLQSIVS
jgi:hypothetical protein